MFSSKPIPQQNPCIYMSNNKLKWKIKAKWENEKSLKNLPIQSLHSPRDDNVACGSMKGTHSTSQPHSNGWGWTHCLKSHRSFSWTWVPWRWKSLREKESVGETESFKLWLWETWSEGEAESICRERDGSWRVRENVKRWGRWGEIRRKRKETVGNCWKNLKRWECIWWLNYV